MRQARWVVLVCHRHGLLACRNERKTAHFNELTAALLLQVLVVIPRARWGLGERALRLGCVC